MRCLSANAFRRLTFGCGLIATAFLAQPVSAQAINIQVENLQPVGGFYNTPVWVGFHDGSFDVYSIGDPASNFPGLEDIAEEGATGPLSTDFNTVAGRWDTTIVAPAGFPGAPVFEPGESVVRTATIPNTTSNRYFSYASMMIPSNDAFFANGNPFAHEVFDAAGQFIGPITIEIRGANILDAGTEVNDPTKGAAFSALGGVSEDEGGVIHAHLGLGDFVGTDTVAGTTITTNYGPDDLIARITITAVPEPSSILLMMSATALFAVAWRKR